MKHSGSPSVGFVVLASVLMIGTLNLTGGKPGPPRRHSAERRQANMHMLRFQDALAAEQWQDALSLCSERIRAKAAEWPVPKDFFTATMPIEHVLAQDFACWSCGENFYGMFVTLSERGIEPRIDWYWGLAAKSGGWEVDYPPVKLDEYVARKKAVLQQRDEKLKAIRGALEPKARAVVTRLTPVSNRFIVGAPMLFQLEVTNASPAAVHYQHAGLGHYPLSVLDQHHLPVPLKVMPAQVMLNTGELPAGSSRVLVERIDINSRREITKPGKYFVRFDSDALAIGERAPHWEPGRFGENDSEPSSTMGLLTVTNRFPSNVVEIEVHP